MKNTTKNARRDNALAMAEYWYDQLGVPEKDPNKYGVPSWKLWVECLRNMDNAVKEYKALLTSAR